MEVTSSTWHAGLQGPRPTPPWCCCVKVKRRGQLLCGAAISVTPSPVMLVRDAGPVRGASYTPSDQLHTLSQAPQPEKGREKKIGLLGSSTPVHDEIVSQPLPCLPIHQQKP